MPEHVMTKAPAAATPFIGAISLSKDHPVVYPAYEPTNVSRQNSKPTKHPFLIERLWNVAIAPDINPTEIAIVPKNGKVTINTPTDEKSSITNHIHKNVTIITTNTGI
ncbi:MAG: hypothetical protein ACAF41_23220 [Leptolyngbya sp. BL-A-14]